MDSSLPPGSIPADQFQPATDDSAVAPAQAAPGDLPEGAIPADQFQSAEDAYGTGEQQAKAGLEGAAEGVLGPLATKIEHNIMHVPKSEMLGRREANPITHAAGQMAGLLGSGVTGVGEGALLEKAGAGLQEAAGLGNLAKDASFGSKVAAGALKAAAENALFQGGDEASKMILSDPDTSAQTAMANVGLAAAVGGTLGAGLGSISPLWNATIGEKAAPILEDMRARFKFRTEVPDLHTAGLEELQNKFDAVHDLRDKLYSASDEGGGIKAEAIRSALPQDTAKLTPHNEEIASKFDDTLEKMRGNEDKYPSRLTNKLEENYKTWQDTAFNKPDATPEDIFNATQDFKKQLQEYSKFNRDLPSTSPEYDFVKVTKDLGHELRTSLENPQAWGDAAKIQQGINKAVSDFIPAEKDFTSKFTSKLAGERVVDPGKFQTYMNQLGKANAELKQEMMKNYLEKHQGLIDAVNKTFTDRGLEPQIAHTATNVLSDTVGKQTTGAKLMDKLLDHVAANTLGRGTAIGVGSTIGHATGAPILGALAGEHLLGGITSSVLQSILKATMEGTASSKGFKSAVDYAVAAAKGERTLGKAVGAVFKAGVPVLTTNLIPDSKDREKMDRVVSHAQSQPNSMLQVNNGRLDHYMPQHQTALSQASTQAVSYLQQIKPKSFKPGPLDRPIEPAKAETARYNRALDIAQQPAVVLQHVKDGTLQPSDIQDLHNLYPAVYQRLTQKLSNEMMNRHADEEHIPYKTRIGISLFLGQPVDGSMQPQSIVAAQPMPKQAPQQPQGGGKSKGSPSKMSVKSSNMYKTPNQTAESDRSDRS